MNGMQHTYAVALQIAKHVQDQNVPSSITKITLSRNDYFLNNVNHTPRQYLGPNFPTFNHRQPRQQENLHYNTHFPNHRQQPYQQTFRQPPQIPQDQLIYMIRTILRENNYQYQTQM